MIYEFSMKEDGYPDIVCEIGRRVRVELSCRVQDCLLLKSVIMITCFQRYFFWDD